MSIENDKRCTFQYWAAYMGGYGLAGCYKPRAHEGDHEASAGGCVGGTRTFPAGTKSATTPTADEQEAALHAPAGRFTAGFFYGLYPGDETPTDEVCSEGHPMLMRAGRFGAYLACTTYPEHKETRPIARPDESLDANGVPAELPGVGEPCPECGPEHGGTLVARRGRFGPFVGCARFPDCDYIKKDGPPPPDQLPFEVACPTCGQGHLVARPARRTGSVFWGCSRYPKCDFTTSREPVGAIHDTDGGPIARTAAPATIEGQQEAAVEAAAAAGATGLCLKCGASIPLPAGDLVGKSLAGGPANPSALQKPGRAAVAARPRPGVTQAKNDVAGEAGRAPGIRLRAT
jgi:putative DNA topoisomerase